MKIGKLENPVVVNDTYRVIYDSGELTSAQTTITISGLTGNTNKEYRLITRLINNNASATNYCVRFNNDSGSNYGQQNMYATGASKGALRSTSDTYMYLMATSSAQNKLCFSVADIYAKSGYIRTAIVKSADNISGTTVETVQQAGVSWNNTTDEVTSIVVFATQTDGLGIGSRIILMEKVEATNGMKTGALEVQGSVYGVWQKVYSTTLAGAATSVTISSLTGNTDVLYRLRARVVGGAAIAAGIHIRPNNDTGNNYGYQYLDGTNTTASAARGVTNKLYNIAYANAAKLAQGDVLIYVKSGFVRTAIVNSTGSIDATTVTSIGLLGEAWNNTADEITSLVVYADDTDGLGIGTYIELEKLVLS